MVPSNILRKKWMSINKDQKTQGDMAEKIKIAVWITYCQVFSRGGPAGPAAGFQGARTAHEPVPYSRKPRQGNAVHGDLWRGQISRPVPLPDTKSS